jgi:hypothetical protein
MVPVNYEETVNVVHYVAKQVPYTVNYCEAKLVSVQAPAQPCCGSTGAACNSCGG